MKKKDVYAALPSVVKTILLLSEGWLVGGALHDIEAGNEPKDYDIIVPFEHWQKVVNSLKHTGNVFNLNTFGGFKYQIPKPGKILPGRNAPPSFEPVGVISVDLWPEELNTFIPASTRLGWLYNLKHSILLHEQA